MSNINSDLLDEDLQAVMGKDRCQNEWTPATKKAEEKKPDPVKKDQPVDASWVSVKAAPTENQRLVNCAKQMVLYGGVSAVLFWWQQAGLLASEAAVPSFIVIALLAGLKIGSCAARG